MAHGKQKRISLAEQVLAHIPSGATAQPISVAALMQQTGLSRTDVVEAVAELRDVFTDASDTPLLSGPKGYVFTFDPIQNASFRHQRAKTAYTLIRRAWDGAIKKYIASLPPSQAADARNATKGFERVIVDLGDLVGAGAGRTREKAES